MVKYRAQRVVQGHYSWRSDTEPLSGDVEQVLAGNEEDFALGVRLLSTLSEKYPCVAPGSKASAGKADGVTVEEFTGKHPHDMVSTHIHMLYGASGAKRLGVFTWLISLVLGTCSAPVSCSQSGSRLAGLQVSNPRSLKHV